MCGLNGIFAYDRGAAPVDAAALDRTRDAMVHRGPDGGRSWLAPDGRLGLGHRRLSILDLSERAAQPMASADGARVVAFNGEIYNYPALRHELEAAGAAFRTTSDTEVLLHLYERDGPGFVRRLRGMFAFALWDGRARRLLLARDPYGIKPLYLADDGATLRFASEVKALLAGGGIDTRPEPAGVVGFHLWGSVPEPFTLYRGIVALPAGHTLVVADGRVGAAEPYASIAAAFAAGAADPVPAAEVAAEVRAAVRDSVAAHLLADVEVGVFLSAGVDSGALLGLMADAGQQAKAITLSFAEFAGTAEDEAPLAAAVAAHYGATHVVRTVGEAEFRADLPKILARMDQPSIDGVNTWFVAKAAREAGLKVALSGVGGDEILAGYPSFSELPRWMRAMRGPARVPGLGRALRIGGRRLGLFRDRPKLVGMAEYGGTLPGAYLLRRGLFLPFELAEVVEPGLVAEGLARLDPLARLERLATPRPAAAVSEIAVLESVQYMRNQLLRDADWAGMAHSLEIRTPLVDAALLARLARVTPHLSGRAGKAALAAAPSRPLPAAVTQRAKTGFGVPTGAWTGRVAAERARGRPLRKGLGSRAWAGVVLGEERRAASA